MAVKPDELIEALKVALQDESVIDKLKFALCEQIKHKIRQEYDTKIDTLKSEIAIRDNQIEELRGVGNVRPEKRHTYIWH